MNVISNKIGNRMFFGNSRINNNDRNNSEEFTGFSRVAGTLQTNSKTIPRHFTTKVFSALEKFIFMNL